MQRDTQPRAAAVVRGFAWLNAECRSFIVVMGSDNHFKGASPKPNQMTTGFKAKIAAFGGICTLVVYLFVTESDRLDGSSNINTLAFKPARIASRAARAGGDSGGVLFSAASAKATAGATSVTRAGRTSVTVSSIIKSHAEEKANQHSPPPKSSTRVITIPNDPALSFYAHQANDIRGSVTSFNNFAGKVTLVLNVATHCGYTESNYHGVLDLYNQYHSQGLEIVAFPCNGFGAQEPGTPVDIEDFALVRE